MYTITNKEIVKNIHMSIDHRSISVINVYGLRVQGDQFKSITRVPMQDLMLRPKLKKILQG